MIDLQHTKEEFKRYLDGYDRENEKVTYIHLRIQES